MNNPFPRKLLLAIVVSVSCITAGCDNSAAEKKSNDTGIVIKASRNEDSSVDQVEQSEQGNMLEMLETIEQLDHLDFQDELSRLNDCLEKYDLSCAKKHLKRARLFAKDKGEKGQLLAARESIKGTALLIEAGEYIADESFSSAKDRIQQAQAVKGNSVLAALLQKTESHYENAHTAYTERKEREARERREQYSNDERDNRRSRCRNPELGTYDNGYTVWCARNDGGFFADILGSVYKSGNRWTYQCLKGGQTHYRYVGTAYEAMMAAVDDCWLYK